MPLGIDRNSGGLAEIQVRRQLKEISLSMEPDLRHWWLGQQWNGEAQSRGECQSFQFIFSRGVGSIKRDVAGNSKSFRERVRLPRPATG
jgi:hypothetical protein